MAASYEDVERWKREGREKGAIAIVSMCDTFSYDDYPVFVMLGEDPEVVRIRSMGNMTKCNEIIMLDVVPDAINVASADDVIDPVDGLVDMLMDEARKKAETEFIPMTADFIGEKMGEIMEKNVEDVVERVFELNDPGIMEAKEKEMTTVTTMTAKEARRLTEKNILSDSSKTKNKIDELISTAVAANEFSIKFSVPKVSEKDLLKKYYGELGYTWKHNSGGDQRDPYPPSITLSW